MRHIMSSDISDVRHMPLSSRRTASIPVGPTLAAPPGAIKRVLVLDVLTANFADLIQSTG
jgi:hypothetical protein